MYGDDKQNRILIVDESPDDRRVFRQYLSSIEKSSWRFEEAETLEEAIAICSSELPDCVLLDYSVPSRLSTKLIDVLKESSGKTRVPVVMITAQDGEEIAAKVLKSGAADYLVKDQIDCARLHHTVVGAIEKATMEQTIREQQKQQELLSIQVGELSSRLSKSAELATIGELSAELAHQLGNPLAAAMSIARRLAGKARGGKDRELGPTTELLLSALNRINQTVVDIRHVVRTSRSSSPPPTPYSLKEQLDSIVVLFTQQFDSKNLEIDIEQDLPLIVGHPLNIQHAILNVLDNAAKAGGKDARISISIRWETTHVLLAIGDNGPGVPDELASKIFEPFFSKREDGTGLGLSLVKRNIEKDNASIRVGTSKLGGALFEIAFPCDVPANSEPDFQ
ncbi:MAG: response regulator [Proteobacteria bacterium]|nr:response regulator [Pseudomonadota bacterium]